MEEEKKMVKNQQYLTFLLDKEVFAFDVLKIKEVLEVPHITRMPKTPDFMVGIINLRGGVVPVVDLRVKFDLPQSEYTVNTAIVIVEVNYKDSDMSQEEVLSIGALVDSVKKVVKLDLEDMEAPPKIGMNLNTELINCIGKKDGQFIIILDVDKLFSEKELTLFQGALGDDVSNDIESDVDEEEFEDTEGDNSGRDN